MNETELAVYMLKDMLYKVHFALGKEIFCKQFRKAKPNDFNKLSSLTKDAYCRKASEIAEIDHDQYLAMIEKLERTLIDISERT